jgi:hypothetical protein
MLGGQAETYTMINDLVSQAREIFLNQTQDNEKRKTSWTNENAKKELPIRNIATYNHMMMVLFTAF